MPFGFSTFLTAAIGLMYALIFGLVLHRQRKAGKNGDKPGGNGWGNFLFLTFIVYLFCESIFRLLLGLDRPEALPAGLYSRLPFYSSFLQAVFLLELTRLFLKIKKLRWPWWALNGVLLVIALAGEWFSQPTGRQPLAGISSLPWAAVGPGLLLTGWLGMSGCVILWTYRALRGARHPLHRNRFGLWLAGLVCFCGGATVAYSTGFSFPSGPLLALLAVGLLSYTWYNHNLLDLRRSGRLTISYFSSITLSMVVFTALFYGLLQYLAKSGSPAGIISVLQALAGAGLVTLLVNPLLRAVQTLIAQKTLQNGKASDQLISSYSREIANIIDLAALSDVVTRTLSQGFDLQHARLFLVNQDGGRLQFSDTGSPIEIETESGIEIEPEQPQTGPASFELSADSPVAASLSAESRPLTQYDIDFLPRFSAVAPSETAALKALAIDLYVSVFIKDRWIGLLGLGTKRSGDRFFEKELDLLETLAEQTAVALENARLYEDLKRHNAENERLNRELTAANEELARLDRAKSDFINIASHELRTPLTQIIGYNDLLSDMLADGSVMSESGQVSVDGVRRAARRLEEIVEMMFDVSKLDLSTLQLSPSPVSVLSVVEAASDKWKSAFNLRSQTLFISKELKRLPVLTADGQRLVQVFSHLIQNAIKATPDGGKVRITGREVNGHKENSRPFVEIVVSDSGIGIAPDDQERIFEKFYRVGDVMLHSSGDIKFKGAGPGLGLTICRGIVQAHGGRIWAESPCRDEQLLPGSKFHVLLPVVAQLGPLK